MKLRNYFKKYFDAELAIILAIFYLITICLNLIKVFSTAYLKGTPLLQGENFFFQIYVLDAITVVGIMFIIAMHTKWLILKRTSWRKILLFHFFFSFNTWGGYPIYNRCVPSPGGFIECI